MKQTESYARRRAPQQVAQILSAWWTRPDPDSVALWIIPAYVRQVRAAWKAHLDESALVTVDRLLGFLSVEQDALAPEYERLFVGPAAVPCPPYEVMWRTDRPPHERGTVAGQSTDEIKKLYGQLGLRLRTEQAELPDHIAIELEALAYASAVSRDIAETIQGRLRRWLPGFCQVVMASSRLEFYRSLSEVTLQCLSGANWRSGIPQSGAETEVRRNRN